ncbi:hypothetical protein ACLB2K_042895 [Fragaria x ananassa]
MAKALISSNNFSRNKKKKQQETAVVILNSNQDVVFSILDKLEPIDLLRFTAVCKEWLALSKKYHLTTQRWSTQLVPMLLILKEGKLRLYNVCAGKIDNNIQLSVLPVKRFCGSSRGWLATVAIDPTDPTVDVVYTQIPLSLLENPYVLNAPCLRSPEPVRTRL